MSADKVVLFKKDLEALQQRCLDLEKELQWEPIETFDREEMALKQVIIGHPEHDSVAAYAVKDCDSNWIFIGGHDDNEEYETVKWTPTHWKRLPGRPQPWPVNNGAYEV